MAKLLVLLQVPLVLSFTYCVRHSTIRTSTSNINLQKATNQHHRNSRRRLSCEIVPSLTDFQESERRDWHVWKTADRLESNGLSLGFRCRELPGTDATDKLIGKVVSILRHWGSEWAGRSEWQGILNKSSLLHEVEESIVALVFLVEFINGLHENEQAVTIVDVCSGKGIFSMLASYIFRNNIRVAKIIMLDKAEIKWNHVQIVNTNAKEERRPTIDTWQCNLHKIDEVVNRLESIKSPIAMVGIHLCKTLSPTCISVFNRLGESACPFLVLAPCCLPRAAQKRQIGKKSVIEIEQFETGTEKEIRRVAKERRNAAMNRKPPARPIFMGEQIHVIDRVKSKAEAPCWKCGALGHVRADCPSAQTTGKPPLMRPPLVAIDVSGVLDSERPFDTYCALLSGSVQRKNVTVVDTGLVNDKVNHQKGNWNGGRKSIYIVST
mmetsp:Transcript_8394/g.12682  ORF Transcript_8394/g.12682 Transcript_8394/m.12682 type:complete len:437 (+) Transcript_8394:172-1482(+)